jgi:hypothetical protein
LRRGSRAFSTFVKDPRLEGFEDLTDPLECDWPTWWYKPTWDAPSI